MTLRPLSNAPPSTIQPQLDKEIRAFLRDLLNLSEQSDWKSIGLFYDDKVDYYGAGTVGLKYIEKDRQGLTRMETIAVYVYR